MKNKLNKSRTAFPMIASITLITGLLSLSGCTSNDKPASSTTSLPNLKQGANKIDVNAPVESSESSVDDAKVVESYTINDVGDALKNISCKLELGISSEYSSFPWMDKAFQLRRQNVKCGESFCSMGFSLDSPADFKRYTNKLPKECDGKQNLIVFRAFTDGTGSGLSIPKSQMVGIGETDLLGNSIYPGNRMTVCPNSAVDAYALYVGFGSNHVSVDSSANFYQDFFSEGSIQVTGVSYKSPGDHYVHPTVTNVYKFSCERTKATVQKKPRTHQLSKALLDLTIPDFHRLVSEAELQNKNETDIIPAQLLVTIRDAKTMNALAADDNLFLVSGKIVPKNEIVSDNTVACKLHYSKPAFPLTDLPLFSEGNISVINTDQIGLQPWKNFSESGEFYVETETGMDRHPLIYEEILTTWTLGLNHAGIDVSCRMFNKTSLAPSAQFSDIINAFGANVYFDENYFWKK